VSGRVQFCFTVIPLFLTPKSFPCAVLTPTSTVAVVARPFPLVNWSRIVHSSLFSSPRQLRPAVPLVVAGSPSPWPSQNLGFPLPSIENDGTRKSCPESLVTDPVVRQKCSPLVLVQVFGLSSPLSLPPSKTLPGPFRACPCRSFQRSVRRVTLFCKPVVDSRKCLSIPFSSFW